MIAGLVYIGETAARRRVLRADAARQIAKIDRVSIPRSRNLGVESWIDAGE